MLTAVGGRPRCDEWFVEPDESSMTSHPLVAGNAVTDRLTYRVHGARLELRDFDREYSPEESMSTSCNTTADVRETDRGLLVGDALWFRSAEDCAAAIQNHERVATQLDCDMSEPAPEKVQRTSRTKFENLLARGGSLFSIVDGPHGQRCKPVRVRPSHGARDFLEGEFEVAVVREDGVKGARGLSYEYTRGADTITLLGPGTTWRDGSAEAFG